MKKISVVLPVYNGEKYLRESIQSVINQTYSNWELIIVDDASTDSSPDIIREFAKTDNRIRFITNPTNQKLPESLNIGFRQASGEYLTWTSDDNLYAGDAFKIMAEALDEEPEYGMVFCDISYIDENGDITGDNSVRG
ncbi:MAG: glycosyltransferase, partial [Clostridiales bacterium]|nr:glycosyltransferase [Clostridiales bacterium]